MDSPCVASCKLNLDKICTGCGRHIEEIVSWNKASDAEHAKIFQRIALRKLQGLTLEPTSPITSQEWQQAKAKLGQNF